MSTKDNYSKAFGKGAKGRTNFLVVGILGVLVAAGAALVTKKNSTGSGAAANVALAPDGKGGVSADKASEAYLQTLRQSNKEAVAKAEQSGGSAVAVLTNKTTKVDDDKGEQSAKEGAPIVLNGPNAPIPQFAPPQGSSVAMAQPLPQNSSQGQYQGQSQQSAQPLKNPAVTAQVNELLATWSAPGQSIYTAPVSQAVVAQARDNASAVSVASDSASAGGAAAGGETVTLIPAGQIMSAVMETEVVSDDMGPVLAKIVSGPYSGARMIGSMTLGTDKVVLSFNRMSFKGKTVPVTAVAIDSNTARTGLADEVDHRWFQKYGMLFLSSFVGGYGEAASQTSEVQSVSATGTVVSKQKLSSGDRAVVALGKSGTAVSQQMAQLSQQVKTMVKVNQGSPVGILFLADLTSAN